MRLREPIHRWLRRLAWQPHDDEVAAVAEYEADRRRIVIFFMQGAEGGKRYFRLDRSQERHAEELLAVIQDGVAWCQRGELPSYARPMDRLPPIEKSSFKRYQ